MRLRSDAVQAEHAVRLTITGHALGETFLDFVADRANRFSLNGWATARDDSATVVVAGPPALIDMLMVACLLGPAACRVDAIAVAPATKADAGAGFRRPAAGITGSAAAVRTATDGEPEMAA